MMEPKQGPLRHRVHGEDIEVPDVRHLGCAGSGEVVLSLDQATAWSKAAVQRYRNQHGLLSSEEIRAMRERFDLSQPELAALLRLDIDTIAPCESDRQSQPAAIDVLLRLVRDVPSNIQYLRTRAT